MLKVSHVHYGYEDESLLEQVSFEVAPGELLHVTGANGSGKTTLLKLLAGLIQPDQGAILYQGHSILANLHAYHRELCYVGHKNAIHGLLTVRENCRLMSKKPFNDTLIDRLLEHWHLHHLADEHCGLLSAGQRRKVALMRLFLSEATLWLLDEPFVALDAKSVELLGAYFHQHLQRQGIIVLTSHQALPLQAGDLYQEYVL